MVCVIFCSNFLLIWNAEAFQQKVSHWDLLHLSVVRIIVCGAALFARKQQCTAAEPRAHVSSFIWAVRGTVIKVSLEKWPDTWLLQLFQRQGANTFGYCLASSRNFYLHIHRRSEAQVVRKSLEPVCNSRSQGTLLICETGIMLLRRHFSYSACTKCVCVRHCMWPFLSLRERD